MSSSAKEHSRPRIFVLHENTPWVEPLRREFAAIDAPFSEWFLDRGLLSSNTVRQGSLQPLSQARGRESELPAAQMRRQQWT
jgi:hypothetical protein